MAHHKDQALREAVGRRVRDLREASEIGSQEKLAHKAGVHRTYVGRLERGENGVSLETLLAILAPLGVSLAEFFEPFDNTVRLRTPRRRG